MVEQSILVPSKGISVVIFKNKNVKSKYQSETDREKTGMKVIRGNFMHKYVKYAHRSGKRQSRINILKTPKLRL